MHNAHWTIVRNTPLLRRWHAPPSEAAREALVALIEATAATCTSVTCLNLVSEKHDVVHFVVQNRLNLAPCQLARLSCCRKLTIFQDVDVATAVYLIDVSTQKV